MTIIEIADEIKQRIDMRDVCEKYGIQVNRSGFCRCISQNHFDTNPSMKVYHDGAHCFSCGAHASTVIDFVMMYLDLTFREACVRMNSDFSLGLPYNADMTKEERDRAKKAKHERAEQRRKLKERHNALQNHVYDAMVRCSDLRNIIDSSQPGSDPLDDYDDRYITAMAELPAAEYALDVAQINLAEFEKVYKVG